LISVPSVRISIWGKDQKESCGCQSSDQCTGLWHPCSCLRHGACRIQVTMSLDSRRRLTSQQCGFI